MKSCFLFGRSDSPDYILPKIERSIEDHYSKLGVRYFYVGNCGNFDRLAAAAVKSIKRRHSDIQLFLLLSYHPGGHMVSFSEGFGGSYYPLMENVPRKFYIVRGNKYMVDTTDSIICYVNHIGNTRNLLEYAQRRQQKKTVIMENVADTICNDSL